MGTAVFLKAKAAEIAQKNIGGSVAEVGVFRGDSAKNLAEELRNRTLYLFDTFEGMPNRIENIDHHKAGDFSKTSLLAVTAALAPYDVIFYPGIFPDSASSLPDSVTFALVHIDVDLYWSTLDACKFFYPRMEIGGFMIFDDYNSPTCKGANKAIDEFFADKPENVQTSGPKNRHGTHVEKL